MTPQYLTVTGITLICSAVLAGACHVAPPDPPRNEHSKAADPATTEAISHRIQSLTPQSSTSMDTQEHALSGLSDSTVTTLASQPQHQWAETRLLAPPPRTSNENYQAEPDNTTIQAYLQPVSSFSIDVDTGSYSNMRRFINAGQLPPRDSVRVEEMLNYFSYAYPDTATQAQPFSVVTELGTTPWNPATRLLHVGLKAYVPPDAADMPSNLVFLIDVSGSMNDATKLGLLKSSISLLSEKLTESDTISIVVYAGAAGTVLEPTSGSHTHKINHALARLSAGGSTNGQEGIALAYQLAADNYVEGGINRVILATDGDFNVGISDVEQLKSLIETQRDSGIALTTLGFGTGNYNDHLMEQLADTGNGNYAYIDTLAEAHKVLVDELDSTLMTVARDVKVQVEFNPALVSEYRLIGYTNRKLANEDFNNDNVDAGDIGAGHTVTALYEIAIHGDGGERHSPLRYGTRAFQEDAPVHLSHSQEIAQIRVRFKLPDADNSELIQQEVHRDDIITDETDSSDAFRFSASVAAFGQLLRDSNRIGTFDYEDAHILASNSTGEDTFGYRAEFIRLVDMANSLEKIQGASLNTPRSGG